MTFQRVWKVIIRETGRAGRDGGEGICIAFYARKDLKKSGKIHGEQACG